jgi:hypothetical protein
MVAVQRDACAAVAGVNDSRSLALPGSWTKIYDVHLNSCGSTICPLGGSHHKINRLPGELVCFGPAEGHRFDCCAIHREREARMSPITNQAHRG